MHANKCLKVVLKSWDYAFFGPGTIFYEKFYFAPSIGPDVSDPEFQIKISFFVEILLIFLLIRSLYNSLNARNDSWHHKFDILSDFAVVLQVFYTPLRSEITKLLRIIFKSVAKTC